MKRIGLAVLAVLLLSVLVFCQETVNFGSIPVGTTVTATYTFRNSTPFDCTVESVGFGGNYFQTSGPFGIQGLVLPQSVPAGGTVAWTVTFRPAAAVSYQEEMKIVVRCGIFAQTLTAVIYGQGAGAGGEISSTGPPTETALPIIDFTPPGTPLSEGCGCTSEIAQLASSLNALTFVVQYDLSAAVEEIQTELIQMRLTSAVPIPIDSELDEIKAKLDNLAGILGEWIVGQGVPFRIEPGETHLNPVPPIAGMKPEIEHLEEKLDEVLSRLVATPDEGAIPLLGLVQVTADSGERFRAFLQSVDQLLIRSAQDLLLINPEDDYTSTILQSVSQFVLAGREELATATSLTYSIQPEHAALLDHAVVDGVPEVLASIVSGAARNPKAQVQLNGNGCEVASTVLRKVGMTLSSVPLVGGLLNAVFEDLAELTAGDGVLLKAIAGMSLGQLELELKLDAIVRGLFGISINEAMDETELQRALEGVATGTIPGLIGRIQDTADANARRLGELETEIELVKIKIDNLATQLGQTLRGVRFEVEPDLPQPEYAGPDYGRGSVLDSIELLRLKLDNLGRILGLSLYGPEMGFPDGFDIEPPDLSRFTGPPGAGPTYDAIKPEIKALEDSLREIRELIERLIPDDGLIPGDGEPPGNGNGNGGPPTPNNEYINRQLALTKKIYVYDEGIFTAANDHDARVILVTTAAFDLAGWVDLTDLREGDEVMITIEISVAGGPFRVWTTTVFQGVQTRGLKYFTEFADGLQEVVGTDVRLTIAQTSSFDEYATPVEIYYQFIVESQD